MNGYWLPGRLRDLGRLGGRGGGAFEVPLDGEELRQGVEGGREHRERADLSRQVELLGDQLSRGLAVPQHGGRGNLQSEPVDPLTDDRVRRRRAGSRS